MIDYTNPTVGDIAMILRAAKAAVGKGRFTLSIGDGTYREDFHLFHWHYPTAYSHETNKLIARGSVEECLNALPAYVENFPKDPPPAALELNNSEEEIP